MKTIDIKGKPYVMVNERIKFFRESFPEWSIITEIEKINEGAVIFKCQILDDKQNVRSTGFALERNDSSYINKTSHIENAETSAIGRALGFLGIGIDASIATAEEVFNAINNQGEKNGIQQ